MRLALASVQERFAASINNDSEPDPVNRALSSSRNQGEPFSAASQRNTKALVGECTNLEKPYLRLTTYPKKEDVRPLKILRLSLAHVKATYVRDEDFAWANEQLKSIRQDLTVQRIRDPFVLEVYETHARILLEEGDLNEFNQCQTMIRGLVDGQFVEDDSSDNNDKNSEPLPPLKQSREAADEFRAYGILYALVRKSWIQLKLELSRVDTMSFMGLESSVEQAVQVVRAVVNCDYRLFFRLYESPPHLSAYLMDFLVKRVRDGAYERMIAAYRPTLSVELFQANLNFSDLEETRHFLHQAKAIFIEELGEAPFWVDCKASQANNR